MMNFMEATPGISTCKNDGILNPSCIQSDQTIGDLSQWESRAKMDHASWGGSSNTPTNQRKGVPIEVLVELANQTMTNPWFTMPHYADDDYVTQFASYINEHLNSQLKVYLEYSNEVSWNPGFVAFYYTQAKGIEAGYDSIPDEFSNLSDSSRDKNYFARLRYYAQRSIEIFDLWTDAGFASSRLIRVAGSFQGDTVLSQQILNHNNGGHFDALAIAPYFYGCSKRIGSCADTETINKVLSEVTTVDEIFEIIDDPDAPNALANTIQKISNHAAIARSAGVKLTTYEGGQHLTATLAGIGDLSEGDKTRLRGLFQDANRDPRMKDRYITLLNAWKAADNTALFSLYTLPQSYYRYGNWGIKEHLGQNRANAPKFDAAMTFQESIGACWWSDCATEE
ncbi:MAG TPA: hypothetical protein EYH35_03220 [Thiotrichaceae bacterium]|nr:hypothetical protein [Thiotrichaceae bacterium]